MKCGKNQTEAARIRFLIGGDRDEYTNSGFDGVQPFDNSFSNVTIVKSTKLF